MVFAIAKITLAMGIIGTVIWYTPVFDLLYSFAYLCFVPIILLVALGMLSHESFILLVLTKDELRTRVANAREYLTQTQS